MECEKCGAGVNEGAETCPECGEPLAANAAETAPEEMAAAAAATPEGMVVGTDTLEPSPVTSTSSEPSGGPRPAIIGAIALVVVVVLAGAWFLMNAQGGNTPAGAVKAMLTAYANYDGAGILAVST